MRRVITWTTAIMVVAAGFALMNDNEANAGLFNRKKCKTKCCTVSCCEPAPCCQPAPCCPEPCCPAPCGCEAAPAAPCGCQACDPCSSCQQLTRREIRKAKRAGCCIQQCSCSCPSPCGCEAGSPCGCGAAPAESGSPMSPEAAPELPADAT